MPIKVLVLEHPRIRSIVHFNDIANTPLWSCLLAGYAAAGMAQTGAEVTLLDANRQRWDFERALREVITRSPDLLCVHGVYFWEHTPRLLEFFNDLRGNGYEGHLNLFGFFPTLAYDMLLEAVPSVDSIAVGECEWTLSQLARRLQKGKAWQDIQGLAHGCGQNQSLPGPRTPESDPDRFPWPWRHFKPDDTVSVLASRGCYNHCRFCPVPSFYNNGPKWRGRQPQRVVEEVRHLKDNGAADFYFVDPNFVGPGSKGKDLAKALCRRLAPLEITFGMETRANDLDAELLEALCSAGLQSLLLGIESGSARILKGLHKHSSTAASETAIRLCREAGIEPEIGFLMFVPDSTVEDLAENFAFLKRNRLLDRLDRTANLLSHRQIIFKGTPGYRQFLEQGKIEGTGPLGFQAQVTWADPMVTQIADIVGHACLYVIKETGRSASPLYWKKNDDRQSFSDVNDYLVKLFETLLADIGGQNRTPPVAEMNAIIETDLNKMIHSG